MLHCEVCGAAVRELADTKYCLECGLYVGSECWRASAYQCRQCAEGGRGPRGRGASLRSARRADRRLREVAAEAAHLRAGSSGGPPGDDLVFTRASLEVKAATAARIGRKSLARLTAAAASRQRLAARLERHASRADDALRATELPPVAQSAVQQSRARPRMAGWLAGAAAAAVAAVAVVMLPNIIGSSDGTREQTLGGVSESMGGAVTAASALASPHPTAEPSAPPAAPTTILAAEFDEVRMNSGLGPEWSGSAGEEAAEVAPVPNAVNRSARLTAGTGSTSEACTEFDAGINNLAATVDVMIATGVARAIVSLESTAGSLTAGYGAERSTLVVGDASAIELEGIAPGEWYRSVIRLSPAGEWQLAPVAGAAASQAAPIEVAELGQVVRVCIGVEGETGSAAHFDNIGITEGGTDS